MERCTINQMSVLDLEHVIIQRAISRRALFTVKHCVFTFFFSPKLLCFVTLLVIVIHTGHADYNKCE